MYTILAIIMLIGIIYYVYDAWRRYYRELARLSRKTVRDDEDDIVIRGPLENPFAAAHHDTAQDTLRAWQVPTRTCYRRRK